MKLGRVIFATLKSNWSACEIIAASNVFENPDLLSTRYLKLANLKERKTYMYWILIMEFHLFFKIILVKVWL